MSINTGIFNVGELVQNRATGELGIVIRPALYNELKKTNIYAISGITNNSINYNLPIITCENATSYVPVIHLKEGNDTKFSLKDDCIMAESSSKEGFIALKDIIIYTIFDII